MIYGESRACTGQPGCGTSGVYLARGRSSGSACERHHRRALHNTESSRPKPTSYLYRNYGDSVYIQPQQHIHRLFWQSVGPRYCRLFRARAVGVGNPVAYLAVAAISLYLNGRRDVRLSNVSRYTETTTGRQESTILSKRWPAHGPSGSSP